MMVATPAFPCMNSTLKVNKTTLNVIRRHFEVGYELTQQNPIPWEQLFSKIDFFGEYNNFIEVTIFGQEENEYNRWKGLIESQLIGFTNNLQKYIDLAQHPRNLIIHPYPPGFERTDLDCKYAQSHYYGVRFTEPQTANQTEEYDGVDLFQAAHEFAKKIYRRYSEEQFTDVDIRIYHLLRSELTFLNPQTVTDQEETENQITNETVFNDPKENPT